MISFDILLEPNNDVISSGVVNYIPRVGESVVICSMIFGVTNVMHIFPDNESDNPSVKIYVRVL